jgi:hypothetical protein
MILSYRVVGDGEWTIAGVKPTRIDYTVPVVSFDEQKIDMTFIETHDAVMAQVLMRFDNIEFRIQVLDNESGSNTFYTNPPLKPPGPPTYHRATEFTFIGKAVDEDVDLFQIKLESYT